MTYNPKALHTSNTGTKTMPAPVSSTYCMPQMTQFTIDEKALTPRKGKFTIMDTKGQLLFDVKGKIHLVQKKRVLCNESGQRIVLMKKKLVSNHDRWEAYRGDDESKRALLFSMAKATLAVWRKTPSFDICMSNNTSGAPDFSVLGDFDENNYAVTYGNVPIAEVREKHDASDLMIGKDHYGVTVYPGVDRAFIATVIAIIDQVKQDDMNAQRKAKIAMFMPGFGHMHHGLGGGA